MMDKEVGALPDGWKWKRLGDISDFQGGSQPPKSNFIFEPREGFVRFLQIRDFRNDKNLTFIPASKKNRICTVDDILIGRYGASVGKILTGKAGAYNVAIIKTIPNESIIDRRFFEWYLRSNLFQYPLLNETAKRAAQDGFSKDDIKEYQVPLPSLVEQQRILQKLDALFARIDEAIALAEDAIEWIQSLLPAALNEVFSGAVEKGWKTDTLKNLTTKIGSGSTPIGGDSAYKASGISLVRSMNVHDAGFEKDGLAFIDEQQAVKLSNVALEEDDVLLNITGASVARCCIVPKEILPARVNQHVSILRVKQQKILSEFLHYFLICPEIKFQLLKDSGGGATREAITKNMLEVFQVWYPSLSNQHTVIKYLNSLVSSKDDLELSFRQKLSQLYLLKDSLISATFNGQL